MTRSRWVLLLVSLAVAATGLYMFLQHEALYPDTSDAYVTAHVVRIEPQVSGRITGLPVKDHQNVNQGQLLMEIDPRSYQIAVQRAQAELALARQQALAANAGVQAAAAEISQRQAQLDNARRMYGRDSRLLASKSVSQAKADSDRDKLHEAEASLIAGQADHNRALRVQDEFTARISVASAVLDRAFLNLSYTTIKAPVSGALGKISVRPGDVVQSGQQLFPLVEDQTFWINANYKETDLARIKPGQPAAIRIDMYPGKTFDGIVESLSPASGASFSLLPPENATGNWVKVTQRFPVRVKVITRDKNRPLRIGASCSVTIDTTGTADLGKSAGSQTRNGE
ncbi:MAG TPA: HlyD family secretion protein [Gammaproteobacteria bacterium]|nr:HlyD family secretion protein [Gammaproteobacteria bacterium]